MASKKAHRGGTPFKTTNVPSLRSVAVSWSITPVASFPSPLTCWDTCSRTDHFVEISQCELVLNGTWDWFSCSCVLPSSPVLINLAGGAVGLTGLDEGVYFDIDSDGDLDWLAWTESPPTDAFLALDRNGNGKIDGGVELFGDNSPQARSDSPNGFAALGLFDRKEYGGNGDGRITENDSVFSALLLWLDLNHDGQSQSDELSSLRSNGIIGIDLAYRESRHQDQFGNEFRYRAKVEFVDGRQRFAYDVFLVRR